MTIKADLLSDFDRDFRAGAEALFSEYRDLVRKDPAMPRDTGKLAKGVAYRNQVIRSGSATADLQSTAVSEAGADYGTILDRSTGRRITKQGGGAFGPFAKPVPTSSGPTRFLKSFRVTTKHVGWWAKVNSTGTWAAALRQLDRFGL